MKQTSTLFFLFAALCLAGTGVAQAAEQAADRPHYQNSRGQTIWLTQAPGRIAFLPAEGEEASRTLALRPELQPGSLLRHPDGVWQVQLRPSWRGREDQVLQELQQAGLLLRALGTYQAPGAPRPVLLDQRVFVELKQGLDQAPAALLAATGLEVELALGRRGSTWLCRAADAAAALAGARAAAALPQVAWAVPDFRLPVSLYHQPSDPLYGLQWHHQQANGAHLHSEEAWDISPGDPQVIVAVIDTGLEESHPDFDPAAIVTGFDLPSGTNDPTPWPSSVDAHGTCCAGEIAARMDNDEGLVGICPACSLMGVRMMDANASMIDISDGYLAIQYAVDNGAWVLSNSWGIDQASTSQVDMQPFYDAIADAVVNGRGGLGAVVLFASGNGDYWGQPQPIGPDELAAMPEVMAVGGTDTSDLIVSYSDYGPNLSVVAPTGGTSGQTQIATTDTLADRGFNRAGDHWAPGWFGDENTGQVEPDSAGNYTQYFNGTSAACPLAAGVVALVLSTDPGLSGQQARFIVEQTADKVGGVTYDANGHHDHYGYGRINAGRAVRAAQIGFDNPGLAACAEGFNCLSGNCEKADAQDAYGICLLTDCAVQADGTPCTDLSACTEADNCQAGACVGTAITCQDGNPCTSDSCDPVAGCRFTANDLACDDSDTCTVDDRCQAGACHGVPLDCDDANPCTDDTCVQGAGCGHTDNTRGCDDGDACTSADVCQAGACAGSPRDCDDGNPCTSDSCDSGSGCAHLVTAGACDDGDACTVEDVCADGLCLGQAASCDDANPCTDDSCDPASGCLYADNLSACDDEDRCTVDDGCAGGVCGGLPKDCSHLDGPCQEGACNPDTGACQVLDRTDGLACDDEDACTSADACHAGRCRGTAVDCSDLDEGCRLGQCDPESGACQQIELAEGAACDDDDPCTRNTSCRAGACTDGEKLCNSGCGCGASGGGHQGPAGLIGLLVLLGFWRRRR